MTVEEILISVVLGLIANEICDISPWCARRLAQLSVRLRYADPERRRIRAEELIALIDERPGKLMKLCTALGFLCAATLRWMHRAALTPLHQKHPGDGNLLGDPALPPVTTLTVTNLSQLPVTEIAVAVSQLGGSQRVVSINGRWGSGKTTIADAAINAANELPAITYNPWLWWNDHARANALGGLPDAIKASDPDLDPVASAFERYLGCHRGAHPTRFKTLRNRQPKRRLAKALHAAAHPVVIALDDIDRIPAERVWEIFDVVAQTAGMEKLGYLLAFDRSLVEQQLPPGFLDRCVGGLRVELACGTCRRRPSLCRIGGAVSASLGLRPRRRLRLRLRVRRPRRPHRIDKFAEADHETVASPAC